MKRILSISLIAFFLVGIRNLYAQSGTIATDGVYVPRLTTVNRNAIATPANGQLIYNTDDNCFNVYQQGAWQKLCGYGSPTSESWTAKANVPGGTRFSGVGFSIDNKGYVGTGTPGYSGGSLKSDFWEYNPATNAWTQKADFGGGARAGAVGFSIGSKGYVGTGGSSSSILKDFWEYDPATNTWTQKADVLGTARTHAVGFSIGSKGYIGTGILGVTNKNDFYEYDPNTNTWTPKAVLGTLSSARSGAAGFSIGNKGYIGSGGQNDFWEYDVTANTWTKKADYPGKGLAFPIGFSMNSKGYIGTGYATVPNAIHDYDYVSYNDFWEYNPTTNTWVQKANFGGGGRTGAVGFAIGNKGYVGTGTYVASDLGNFTIINKDDFWEYSPSISSNDVTLQGNEFNGSNQLLQLDASGNINIAGKLNTENFIAPTLLNSWVNYNTPTYPAAGYYKDKESRVYLKGAIKNGTATSGTILFNLPAGYRPAEVMGFVVANGTVSSARVEVYPSGDVKIISGDNTYLSLDQVSFRVN